MGWKRRCLSVRRQRNVGRQYVGRQYVGRQSPGGFRVKMWVASPWRLSRQSVGRVKLGIDNTKVESVVGHDTYIGERRGARHLHWRASWDTTPTLASVVGHDTYIGERRGARHPPRVITILDFDRGVALLPVAGAELIGLQCVQNS